MVTSWRDLPGPARTIGGAISRAVEAARDADAEAYPPAATELATLPPEQAGGVLGAVLRSTLEDLHPDGLDGDDIRAVLAGCYQHAATFLPATHIDVHPLVAALSSALGIHEPGVTYREITAPSQPAATSWADPETPSIGASAATGDETVLAQPPTPTEYAFHAPLLIAYLLDSAGRPLNRYLDDAFAEIARAETMEMP